MTEKYLGYGSPEALEAAITAGDLTVYGEGLVNASVCSSLPLEEVKLLMAHRLCGTTSGWEFSKNETFSSGEPNPCPCNKLPETHKHFLFLC